MSTRERRHDCEQVRKVAQEYGNRDHGHLAHVRSGPFGLSIIGVPLDVMYPKGNEDERYIPLATHCPYCGENIKFFSDAEVEA